MFSVFSKKLGNLGWWRESETREGVAGHRKCSLPGSGRELTKGAVGLTEGAESPVEEGDC
jgi:hypothetical protein